jgi:hypothetical protein
MTTKAIEKIRFTPLGRLSADLRQEKQNILFFPFVIPRIKRMAKTMASAISLEAYPIP